MKNVSRTTVALIASIAVAGFPLIASAHQHAVYEIGGQTYEFVVGSLSEPIAVDDKTGVDFRVSSGGRPLSGLEQAIKVELIAGEHKKVLDLSPVYNTPGSYSAKFYPTVATTLRYRFFGTINDTPVDLTFTCRAEGAEAADEGVKQVSEGVKQISKSGGYGCPAEKSALGFPEESASISGLAQDAANTRLMAIVAIAMAASALGVVAFRRRT